MRRRNPLRRAVRRVSKSASPEKALRHCPRRCWPGPIGHCGLETGPWQAPLPRPAWPCRVCPGLGCPQCAPPAHPLRRAAQMVLREGGPCVVVYTPRGESTPRACGVTTAHVWYAGPTCKKCYDRGAASRNQSKRSRSDVPCDEDEGISGGDNLLEVLKICAARCVLRPCPLLRSSPAPTMACGADADCPGAQDVADPADAAGSQQPAARLGG